MLIVPIQVLLVKVIENSKGSVGHIQGIEMNASDMMVDQLLHLICRPLDAD